MRGGASSVPHVALVLAGGAALGAYQAGAFAALNAAGVAVGCVAGSSIGAVNAAIIAGNRAEDRAERLCAFWGLDGADRGDETVFWRHWRSWISAPDARLFGAAGRFAPRFMTPASPFAGFYDLRPLRERLARLVDFGRLNSGEIRMVVATTDIETGQAVYFDTAAGQVIGMDHILASCGFLPEFPPVEIDGRLLGDGGLAANAPIDPVLWDDDPTPLLCFVLDLYARDGARPRTLEDALARKSELLFGNQTIQRLEIYRRERSRAKACYARRERLFHLSYRAPPDEAGSEKAFDHSRANLARRSEAGARDMREALAVLAAAAPGERDEAFLLKYIRTQPGL
jgi:NTE family protein